MAADAAPVVAHVAPDGSLLDEASPELARIRARIGRVGERLRSTLRRMIEAPGADAFVRDDFITQRNGRYVIPVRTDAARPVRGIVHAASSSGATLFVEPLESVELNNELVRLSDQEREERERVLRDWADRFRSRLDAVREAVRMLARADSLQARASFAEAVAGVRPEIGRSAEWALREVRHPLLDRALQEQGGACVPLSVELHPSDQVLILSGPNAGGKTVALKTLGLAVLMAQSGLPVTASAARLPLFVQVRADIGDHQSIEANLSTFSAHVGAVARFLDEARPPGLFLFDEIGTGTEPAEGASLAQAVLENLLVRKIRTVATTHHGSLKAWAVTTEGVVSAALEFDVRTLRPTFRVLMGAAGVSAGLEIASRHGLGEALIARARALMGPEAGRSEAYLARVREMMAEVERRRDELVAVRESLEDDRRRLEARVDRETEALRRDAAQALEAALAQLREAGRREVEAIRDAAERARAERRRVRAETKLRQQAAGHRTAIVPPRALSAAEPTAPLDLSVGASVLVRSLGRQGIVEALRGDRIVIRLGPTTFAADRDDLAPAPQGPPPPTSGRVERRPEPEEDAPAELMLIGKTVDEALPELDRFLDRAALAGRSEVRIVHGHGTGRLRAAVRRFLDGHPLVESHRPGERREGGEGSTVVRIA